jgi:two-component system KDP operon response regulator KdpE
MNIGNETGQIKILVIEDSPEIQEAASLIFELHWPNASVIQAFKGGEGLDKARAESPDIVLLDLGLPDMDGLRVLKEIRDYSNVPVIILTVRGEEMDKVRGLEMGADDYVIKPFDHKELLARMKAVLARKISHAGGTVAAGSDAPNIQEQVKIDLETGQATRNGKPVKLTSTESSLLKYIASQSGKPISEREILSNIWGEEYSDCSEYLQAYVKRLREKLEGDPDRPRIIVKDTNGYRILQSGIS